MSSSSVCALPAAGDRHDTAAGRERLALVRLLIWAEHEASGLGCADAAAHLRAALRSFGERG